MNIINKTRWIMLANFALGILVPLLGQAEIDITLQPPYSIPNGVNGNEQNFNHQTFKALTTYEQLKAKLLQIQQSAKNNIDVGPLIKNGNNGGLIDIDISLNASPPIKSDVCGAVNSQPTVREAVICTINDGGRGNQDPNQIGFSTQGRALWGARLGNENGIKVMLITQQHGNEVQSTEAALKVIQNLAHSGNPFIKNILKQLNILFIVRANPDGGEPSQDCFIGTPFGSVIQQNCAITRTNVDPQAGGAYSEDSESDFFGTVGVGYNLNRYHLVDLEHPIRPLENQAMVAIGLSWRPEVVLDLHGDIGKTACTIDPDSIVSGAILGQLPSAQCLPGSDKSAVVFSPLVSLFNEDGELQQKRARNLAASVAYKVEESGFGIVNRFAQAQIGAGVIGEGTTGDYAKIGAIVGGWESLNFLNAVSLSVQSVSDGESILGLDTEWFLGNKFNGVNTKINRVAIMAALEVIAEWAFAEPINEGGYCGLPLTTAVKVAFPENIFGPDPGYGPFLIPLIGDLLQVLDNCPNNP